jgi:hypothetical protein
MWSAGYVGTVGGQRDGLYGLADHVRAPEMAEGPRKRSRGLPSRPADTGLRLDDRGGLHVHLKLHPGQAARE